MKQKLEVCGNCFYFAPHKHLKKFPGGWWIGDGKCECPYQKNKYTVLGDTCKFHFGKNRTEQKFIVMGARR